MSSPVAHTTLPRIGDGNMNKLIDLIERALNRLEAMPLNNAKLIKGVVFTAAYPASTRVFHGLGYKPSGYFAVNSFNAFEILTEFPAETADPSNYINLAYGSAGTVDVVVF